MFASILAALKAIPDMVAIVRELVDGIKELAKAQKLAAQNTWLNNHSEVIRSLKRAKTDADRFVVLRALQKAAQDFPD